MKRRVVIVGAGPAGLATAYRLGTTSGVEVILFEADSPAAAAIEAREGPE